ncbi:MAG: HEAT repeat domain-containing protein [Phycisphaerales bacterium]
MPFHPIHIAALSCLAGVFLTSGMGGCGFKIEPDPELMGTGNSSVSPETKTEQPEPVEQTFESRSITRSNMIDRLMIMATSPSPQVRANAIEGLSRAGGRAEPVVALALRDENAGVRSVAVTVAGRAGFRSLSPTLRSLLTDSSPFVRASAVGALNALGAPTNPSELSDMLLSSQNPRLRSHAAFVLGELGDATAVPMLQQAWSTPIRNASEVERRLVRLQIAEALVKLGEQDSIDAIRAALYPARPEELEATALAVQIIGQVKDRGSIDQLIILSETPERVMPAEVRLTVAGSLARMGMTEGGFIADEYRENPLDAVRAQVATVYGRTGRNEHVAKLGRMLEDPSELVRVAAAAGALDLLYGGAKADADG